MTEPDGDGGPGGAAAGAPIRVLIAEDQALLRTTLAALLQAEEGMSVVGTAGDGARALALTAELRPDVVLMDIQMPGLSGIEATARICADPALGGTRVLILTMFEVDDYVLGALRAGASGFLLKDTDPQVLVDAIRTVHAGQSLLSPRALERLVAQGVLAAVPRRWGDAGAGTDFGAAKRPTTAYFARDVKFGPMPENGTLTLHVRADDGAVIYVNGTEVARVRMPSGTVTPRTKASNGVTVSEAADAMVEVVVPGNLLTSEITRIAVEEHSAGASDPSLTFDMYVTLER